MLRKWIIVAVVFMLGGVGARSAAAQQLLIPMDLSQTNHLKAYGLAYHALANGHTVDWLLNYRGGSFLMPATQVADVPPPGADRLVVWCQSDGLAGGIQCRVVLPLDRMHERGDSWYVGMVGAQLLRPGQRLGSNVPVDLLVSRAKRVQTKIGVRVVHQRFDRIWLESQHLLERIHGLTHAVSSEGLEQLNALVEPFQGFAMPEGRAPPAPHLPSNQLDGQLGDDGRCDLVLDRKQVGQLPVVTLRPQRLAGSGVQELGGDADVIARPAHGPLQDGAHTQFPPDPGQGRRPVPVRKARVPVDHQHPGYAGQVDDDVLGDAIAEIRLFGVAAQVLEGKHGQGGNVGQGRRLPEGQRRLQGWQNRMG